MNAALLDIGIAGLGSVGASLALNIADHGYSVAAYDWDEMALGALRLKVEGRSIEAANSLSEFVSLLRVPRTVMILLPAGPAISGVINALVPLLAPGDVVIDAGNSYFKDTDARSNMLAGKGIKLLGVGLSGRERGARHETSICDTFYLQPDLPNLLSDSQFAHCLRAQRDDLRDVVRLSVEQGIPAPALTASLVYFDAHRRLNPDDQQVPNRHPGSRSAGNTKRSEETGPGDAGTRSSGEREAVRRICT